MGSSKKQTVGYKYYLGAHMYLGHAEFDKITRIRVANKYVWRCSAMDEQIFIDAPDVFGGEEREGGIRGYVDVLSGKADQTVNDYLASVQPVAGEDIPAYRGKTSLVLRQPYMGTNPYIKNWQVTGQRIHKTTGGTTQWYDQKSAISGQFGTEVSIFIALDASLSMDVLEGNGLSRLDNAKAEIENYLDYVKTILSSASTVNIAFCSWNASRATTTKNNASSADIDSLISTVNSVTTAFGTDFEQAAIDAASFFSGKGTCDRYYVFITDGEPFVDGSPGEGVIIAQAAADVLDSIPSLLRFGVNIDLADTTYTAYIDNTPDDGVVVIQDGEEGKLRDTLQYATTQEADMNPAHIIRECLTDTRFGLGYTSADIDDAAFTAAADALYDEEFGLSFYWNNDQEIEEFIRNVLRHIDATLYVDNKTGKFVLRLIRDDYDIGTLITLDQTNIVSISDYKKPTIGELTNYVTINYWDRSTYEDSSISVQDIALSQMQGSVVSATVDYDGITRGSLASKVASRDLAALSNPLITCTIIASREASTLNNGDAFVLDWPKYGISNVIMRVGEISFGELADGKVRIKAVQDVFALPAAIYSQPEDSGWTAVVSDPVSITNQIAQEAPYWLLIQNQGEDFVPDALDGYLMTAAGQSSSDAIRYRIWTDETGDYVEQEYSDFCPVATIDHDWPKANNGTLQKTVNVTGIDAEDIDQIEIGSAALINNEWISVVSITATGANTATVEFNRSVVDSAIADHTAGDKIYFFGSSLYGTDNTLFQSSDSINVKLTPQTGNGQLDVADATAIALTFDQRQYRAYPPANIKLNTVYFPDQITDTGSVDSTWSHRDRLLQTAGLIDFDEASIGPELSTTYTTTIYRVNNDTVLDTNAGLTGTSNTLSTGSYDGLVRYEIKSVRDSLDSFYSQSHEFVVSRTKPLQEESFGDFLYTEDLEILMTES